MRDEFDPAGAVFAAIASKVHDARRRFVERPNVLLLGRNDYDVVRGVPLPYSIAVRQKETGAPVDEEIYGLRIVHVDADNFFEVAYIL